MPFAFPHLVARIFGRPLAVAPAYLQVALEGVGPRLLDGGDRLPEPAGMRERKLERSAAHKAQAGTFGYQSPSRLAVVPIHGALAMRGGVDAASNELKSYDAIRHELRSALADQSVGGVLLDVDSPGGEVAGLPELAAEILAARSSKPVFAIANTDAFSAAYWLACGAEQIWVTPSGSVGSIGVVAAHLDVSGRDAQKGERWTFIHAGAKKVDGHSHAPLAPSVHAEIQADVDRLRGEFVEHVARARGVDVAAVRATEAGVIPAHAAIAARLADHVGTYEQAINALADRVSRGSTTKPRAARGAKSMPFDKSDPEFLAFLAEHDAKADAKVSTLEARLTTAEKLAADAAAKEKARVEATNAASIEALKQRAAKAGAPVPAADLEKVKAAFARGDSDSAHALIDAFGTRAEALGGGAVRSHSTTTPLGGDVTEDAAHAADMKAFRERQGLDRKEA